MGFLLYLASFREGSLHAIFYPASHLLLRQLYALIHPTTQVLNLEETLID